MVRFRRIHPPAVHTQLEDTFIQIFPIDITGFRIIGIVYAYSGRIFHIGRPSIESRLGPCRKVKQHTILVQFPVRLGHRSKRRPDRNQHMRIHSMHIINHLFRIAERRVLKVHSIPQIVVSPVLPILNDSIKRHT